MMPLVRQPHRRRAGLSATAYINAATHEARGVCARAEMPAHAETAGRKRKARRGVLNLPIITRTLSDGSVRPNQNRAYQTGAKVDLIVVRSES